MDNLLSEKEQIKKGFEGMTLSDIYEEKSHELERLYEIDEEIQRVRRG